MPRKTAKIIAAPLAVLAIAIVYSLASYKDGGSKEPFAAIVVACLSCAISAGLYLLPFYGKQATVAAMFIAGSFIRIICISAGVILGIKFFELQILPFLFWTALLYITFLVTETYFCVRYLSQKRDTED